MTEMHSRTASADKASAPDGVSAADLAVNAGVLLLGVVLGMFNLASNAENGLRIPALLAAMLLFASSLSEIVQQTKSPADEAGPEPDAPAGRAVTRGSGGMATGAAPPAPPARSPMVPVLVLCLAVWVGIAALLNPEAEQTLRGLCLLAAFLLCYNAISELRQHDG